MWHDLFIHRKKTINANLAETYTFSSCLYDNKKTQASVAYSTSR